MSFIPIFTPGNINVPSRFIPVGSISNPVFVSAYTGEILTGHPTFKTKTDDPTGKNPTFHGGILINDNTVMCHQQGYDTHLGQRRRY